MDDAMPDLGNLPKRVKTIRNRRTGVEFHKSVLESTEGPNGETNGEAWVNAVRYAFNHQDEIEMIMEENSKTVEELEEMALTGSSGAVSIEGLKAMHWKKLQAHAKALGVATAGTKMQIIERVLAAS